MVKQDSTHTHTAALFTDCSTVLCLGNVTDGVKQWNLCSGKPPAETEVWATGSKG